PPRPARRTAADPAGRAAAAAGPAARGPGRRPAGQGSPARAAERAGWVGAPVAVEVVRGSR
ncbi:hypothetical protein ACFV4N_41800, partial [Actinosynnema sp. NPDC059797]